MRASLVLANCLTRCFPRFARHAQVLACQTPVIVDASLVGDPSRATFVVEALDPAAIIVADGIATAMLSDGYHAKLPLNAATRLLGRPFVAFESFQDDLSDDKLKQRDWALIKTLKRA